MRKFFHDTSSATGTFRTISNTTHTTTELILHRRAASARVPVPGEAFLQQVGEHSAGAQSQQRNRNREKREVIEEHYGEQSSQRQLQQQCGKTGESQTCEQRAFRNFSGRRNRRGTLNDCRHDELGFASLADSWNAVSTTNCHPERSEGSRCLPARPAPSLQAETKIPRFARDDRCVLLRALPENSLSSQE